jgi:thiol-disulfide isomerase/thioredoxin
MTFFLALILSFAAPAIAADAKCDDAGQVYRVCSDQAAAYESAEQGAQAAKKNLIVVFGAEWCPWCHSLHRILKDPANEKKFEKDFALFEAGLYQEREKSPSGQAVLDKLLGYAGEKTQPKGIPILAVVDPVKRKALFIDTEKLEKNTATTKGHDPDKVLKSIKRASKGLRRGEKDEQ